MIIGWLSSFFLPKCSLQFFPVFPVELSNGRASSPQTEARSEFFFIHVSPRPAELQSPALSRWKCVRYTPLLFAPGDHSVPLRKFLPTSHLRRPGLSGDFVPFLLRPVGCGAMISGIFPLKFISSFQCRLPSLHCGFFGTSASPPPIGLRKQGKDGDPLYDS